jgi:hypothetical protein
VIPYEYNLYSAMRIFLTALIVMTLVLSNGVGAIDSSLLAFPHSALAQIEAAIRGSVIAEADRSILTEATVRLEGYGLSKALEIRPEPDGRFAFQRLTPGDYSLTVTHENFLQQRYDITLKPRELQTVAVELKVKPLAQVVEVAAASDSIQTVHSPGSTLIDASSLGHLPLAQRSSLTDVILTAAPGMIRGHDDFVHIRGHEVALNPFVNGVSFWENPHSVFSSGLGVDYIESVNVMTGGFSAEYGNRFGGVLDVVTKSGFRMKNRGRRHSSAPQCRPGIRRPHRARRLLLELQCIGIRTIPQSA